MKYEDIDKFARMMPSMSGQFTISERTTFLLGDRLVEMLDKVEMLEKKLHEGGPGVVHLLEATATERDELKGRVDELEGAKTRLKCALVGAGVFPGMVNAIEKGGTP